MKRITSVDTSTCLITVNMVGVDGTYSMDRECVLGHSQVRLTPADAKLALNRVVAGFGNDVCEGEGVAIEWTAKSALDKYFPTRIVEVSHVVNEPIEYRETNSSMADLMFMIAQDIKSGQIVFVDDMFAANPFVSQFKDARIYHFGDLVGMDNIIHRGFVGQTAMAFSVMMQETHKIHTFYGKIKD